MERKDGSMKRVLLHGMILFAALLFVECGPGRNDKVFVVEKTKAYHIETCSRLNMADAIIMTREKAKAMNCKACPYCKPDSVLSVQRKD